jgi:CTP:molybdopterin cytidylyltransferase MocA
MTRGLDIAVVILAAGKGPHMGGAKPMRRCGR